MINDILQSDPTARKGQKNLFGAHGEFNSDVVVDRSGGA
jgi:hypothetical protein